MSRPTLAIRRVTTKRLVWREYTLRIRYTYRYQRHRYFNGTRFQGHVTFDMLEVEVLAPHDPSLCPLTESGYRAYTLRTGDLRNAGGPVAFVRRHLDDAARDPRWIKRDLAARQLNLFGHLPTMHRTRAR